MDRLSRCAVCGSRGICHVCAATWHARILSARAARRARGVFVLPLGWRAVAAAAAAGSPGPRAMR